MNEDPDILYFTIDNYLDTDDNLVILGRDNPYCYQLVTFRLTYKHVILLPPMYVKSAIGLDCYL